MLPTQRRWRYSGAMPSIQIKGVPDDVHATYRRRAAAAGQSLQEYLLAKLVGDAAHPTLDELFDRVEARAGGRVDLRLATELIRADRDDR